MSETGSVAPPAASDESAAGAEAEPDATAHGTVAAPDAIETPWWVRHYTFTGTAVGLIFIWFSLTPSLLPRGPLFQALVSGFSGAIGYGLGVFAVWLVKFLRSAESSPPPPRVAWLILIPVGVIGQVDAR